MAVAVITIVPTTAGPIPGPVRRAGGMSAVRNSQEIADAPLATTVTSTKTSGTITTTRDSPISTVATTLRTLRPDRCGDRSIGRAADGSAREVVAVLIVIRPGTCGSSG